MDDAPETDRTEKKAGGFFSRWKKPKAPIDEGKGEMDEKVEEILPQVKPANAAPPPVGFIQLFRYAS